MTKAVIVKKVAKTLGIKPAKANNMVEIVLAEVKKGLIEDSKVVLRKFGTFRTIDKKARMGRNPKTGEDAKITARRVPNFKASKQLKRKINR